MEDTTRLQVVTEKLEPTLGPSTDDTASGAYT